MTYSKLILGDCVEKMKELEGESVDLTVTSPPYDNLRTYFGNNSLWNEQVWKNVIVELLRVTKTGGVVVWVVADATIKGSETGTSFKQALLAIECGFNLHDTMIWIKDGGGAIGSNKCYTQNFEYMFVFSKGKIKTTNLIYDKPNGNYGKPSLIKKGRRLPTGEHKIETRKPTSEFSRRNNYWYIAPQKGEHPAVFPEKLAHDHIISWSNENDIVLDPFMGSCTTGKMAKELNRNFIGIELDGTYFKIAEQRIQGEK